MPILGIWDGHDSGAALIEGSEILFAVNEERLTRRKLEIRFPAKSIQACLDFAGLSAQEIRDVAVSTSDPAKTFSRVFPNTKEKYYLIRRRKLPLTKSARLIKQLKYKITEFPPNALSEYLSRLFIGKELSALGFRNFNLHIFDHHYSHAASAAFGSGFDKALVVTLDGLGDGLSGSIYLFENGSLKPLSKISAKNSLGIFFEHVTNLLNMRELEDEGKVMALADFSLPFLPEQNPMIEFFEVNDLDIKAKYSSLQMYDELQKILWHTPMEQFAYFAQQALDHHVVALVKNAMRKTGLRKLALSGGVFSNIKINRKLRLADDCERCFVFPHMGDGGLAAAAAMALNHKLNGASKYDMIKISFGLGFENDEVKSALEQFGVKYEFIDEIEMRAAELVADGEIIFWFRGRMEFGPRALGNRSIVARPDSPEIKDRLNLLLKKRVWFQPFCPSMLESDAERLLDDYDGDPNYHMTNSYMVKKEFLQNMRGVINIDGSCRPQTVHSSVPGFYNLLKRLKEITGFGVVLNTSFNIHGLPLVCRPEEALEVFTSSKVKYMILENYLVSKDE
ncbi:MAG: hypothetical protein GXO87_07715 [Chlorobi bacterium]|nr:hypothetical protein [Chlorobiota bacterium]